MSSKRDRVRLRRAAEELIDSNASLCDAVAHLVSVIRGDEQLHPEEDLDTLLERVRKQKAALPAVRASLKDLG